jgi:hypothetical protein
VFVVVAGVASYGGSCGGGPVGTSSGGDANSPPSVIGILVEPASIPYGGTGTVTVTAQDAEGDALSATWSCDAGTLEADPDNPLRASYQAPDSGTGTEDTIRVTVSDSRGASTSSSVKVALPQPVPAGPTATPKPDPTCPSGRHA